MEFLTGLQGPPGPRGQPGATVTPGQLSVTGPHGRRGRPGTRGPRGSNRKSSSVNISVIENVVKRIISDFQRQGNVSMFGECIEVRTHLFECSRNIYPSNGRKMKFLIHSSSKVYDPATIARLFEGGRKFIT